MKRILVCCAAVFAAAMPVAGQLAPAPETLSGDALPPIQVPADTAGAGAIPVASTMPGGTGPVAMIRSFRDSDVKFDVERLMDVLRDKRHEGWVLAAYPDPKTAQPLIGAGFSLDLPERPHPQPDPLNPNPFIEASSADLWQAAGLDSARLDTILGQFRDKLDAYGKSGFRRQIWSLEPQITDEDANALLRVGIIQAVYNARAYCRYFDRLRPSQQMALTQLVYQMGYNLQQFSTFLSLINQERVIGAEERVSPRVEAQYWREVQLSLVQSQWARLYRDRAKAVIAMLDPRYMESPTGAERSIGRVLRPVRRARHHSARVRNASYTRRSHSAARRRAARGRRE